MRRSKICKKVKLHIKAKTKEKIDKKKSLGKELKSRYSLLVHDLKVRNDQYVMVGEAYYPTYRSVSMRDHYYRRYMEDTRAVFDGYLYTHAIVAAFDQDGQLLWDHSVRVDRKKHFRLRERVNSKVDDDFIYLLYPDQGTINHIQIANEEKNHEIIFDKPF